MPKHTINSDFSSILRDQMSDKQFERFVVDEFDHGLLCEMAEDWDDMTKAEVINKFKKGKYNS